VSDGAAPPRPGARRELLAAAAVALAAVALAPPLASRARSVEAWEALQFCLLALVVPAFVVLGAPWRRLGMAARGARIDAEEVARPVRPRVADRVADGRRRRPGFARSLLALGVDGAVMVVWRVPAAVDAVARHGWAAPVEALTLVPAGVGLWLELVESPPVEPRSARPKRVALAALAMWSVWVAAYVVGLAQGSVYPAFVHRAGRGLSVSADQALTTGVLWFVALCMFLPVIFSNLVLWLRADEDADEALYRLVRDGRRAGPPSGPPRGAAASPGSGPG